MPQRRSLLHVARSADGPKSGYRNDGEAAFDRKMLEILVCPVTHGQLIYDARNQELISRAAHLAYPIRDGIPIMLPDEAREIS